MIREVKIDEIPQRHQEYNKKNLLRIPENFLKELNMVDLQTVIGNNLQIQVAIRLLISNEDQQYFLTLPRKYSEVEFYNYHLFHYLPRIFSMVRIVVEDSKVAGVLLKEVREEARQIYYTIIDKNQIDSYLINLTSEIYKPLTKPERLRAFQIINENAILSDNTLVDLLIANPFIDYLMSESIRQDNVYSIPTRNFLLDQIQDNIYLNQLAYFFEKVLLFGSGDPNWKSYELIVANAYDKSLFSSL